MVTKTVRMLCMLGSVAAWAAPASALWTKMASLERVRPANVEDQAHPCRTTFLDDGRHGWIGAVTNARPFTLVMFRTTDGCESWERMETGISTRGVGDLEFVDARNGWLVTAPEGELLRTTDGGENWRREEVESGWEATKIVDVEMLSARHGYGVGSSGGDGALFEYVRPDPLRKDPRPGAGRPPWWRPQVVEGSGLLTNLVVHSPDWMWMYAAVLARVPVQGVRRAGSSELIPVERLDGLSCVWSAFFLDRERGWLGGLHGSLWRTDDGGVRWTPQDTGIDRAIKGIHFTSRREGRAIGGNGEILATSNGGREWRQVHYLRKSCMDLDYFGGEYLITSSAGLFHDAPLRLGPYRRLTPRGGGG